MNRAFLPFLCFPSLAAKELLGPELSTVAVLALRAMLRTHKSLEVAHQQIRFGEYDLAFSSRVSAGGEVVMELELGDPKLANRVVLEDELNKAVEKVRIQRGIDKRRKDRR